MGRPTSEAVTQPDGSRPTVVHTDLAVWGHRQTERLMEREDVTAAQARTLLVDKTRLSFSSQHGPQVAYARPDGAIFLWYPGNAVVLQGRWEIRENVTDYMRAGELLRSLKSADVCFQYGANTYNPATAQRAAASAACRCGRCNSSTGKRKPATSSACPAAPLRPSCWAGKPPPSRR